MKLDNLDEYVKLKDTKVLMSIKLLADQMHQAWDEVTNQEMPEGCSLAKNVVVCGMGGSALGGRIVDSLKQNRARAPIEIFTEYHLPHYVGKQTLVIVSSYSGNTEEALSVYNEAQRAGAQVFGITTGGKLAEKLAENKNSGYVFDPKHNPSGQPRLGLGYSIATVLAVLAKCEYIAHTDEEMQLAMRALGKVISELGEDKELETNIAKKMAMELKDKMVMLIASEHLVGVAHAVKNQLNETAKVMTALYDLPELNHHLMEGLRNPAQARAQVKFLMFESDLYDARVKKRYPITKEVIGKNEVEVVVYRLGAETKLAQVLEVLALGSFVSLYLAVLYGADPSEIPWVDYFKKKLSEI